MIPLYFIGTERVTLKCCFTPPLATQAALCMDFLIPFLIDDAHVNSPFSAACPPLFLLHPALTERAATPSVQPIIVN